MKNIYDFKSGERFELNGKIFIFRRIIKRFMPTIGKVPNVETECESDGNIQLFFRPIEVKQVFYSGLEPYEKPGGISSAE